MATAKQTAANRMNAQKSTVPRTTEGKAASWLQRPAARHLRNYPDHIRRKSRRSRRTRRRVPRKPQPRLPEKRLSRVEAELWQSTSHTFLVNNAEAPASSSGDAFATAAPTFERLQRVVSACEHTHHRAQGRHWRGLMVCEVRKPTLDRLSPTLPPASRTIRTQFHENGFGCANSRNPARNNSHHAIDRTEDLTYPAETRQPAEDRDQEPPEMA